MDVLLQKAQERLAERNPFIMSEVQKLVDHSAPIVSQAFCEQTKKDLPAFLQAAGAERDTFVEELQKRLNERLTVHHQKLLARYMNVLREEFPAVRDEKLHEAMMANLQTTVDALVRKYYVEELRTELLALYGQWDDFPVAPPVADGEPPLEDQLLANLLDLLKLKLAQSPTALASANR
jgi:hypothetical protein